MGEFGTAAGALSQEVWGRGEGCKEPRASMLRALSKVSAGHPSPHQPGTPPTLRESERIHLVRETGTNQLLRRSPTLLVLKPDKTVSLGCLLYRHSERPQTRSCGSAHRKLRITLDPALVSSTWSPPDWSSRPTRQDSRPFCTWC